MVFAPGSQGELGITPRHAPLLTLLKPGEIRVQTPDGPSRCSTSAAAPWKSSPPA